MKIKWTGSQASAPFEVAEHRNGNAVLNEGDTFEVPDKLGKSLLSDSAHYEDAESKKTTKGEE